MDIKQLGGVTALLELGEPRSNIKGIGAGPMDHSTFWSLGQRTVSHREKIASVGDQERKTRY